MENNDDLLKEEKLSLRRKPCRDTNYWEEIVDVMGTEFGNVLDAEYAIKDYAMKNKFTAVRLSDTRFGCRFKDCPFVIAFEDASMRTLDEDGSHPFHEHQAPLADETQKITAKSVCGTFLKFSLLALAAGANVDTGKTLGSWDLRQVWRSRNPGMFLPGMCGFMGPAFAGSSVFAKEEQLDDFHWLLRSRPDQGPSRYQASHFSETSKPMRMIRAVVRTESVSASEMMSEISDADAAYLKWWLSGCPSTRVCFLRVLGANAFEIERTCMWLQHVRGVFSVDWEENHHNRYRPEEMTASDGAYRHAIFVPKRAGQVDNRCLMAIDAYALMALRYASLTYIPIHMRMPAAPLLVQAWSRRPLCPAADSYTRLHGMMATLCFFVQHLTQPEQRAYRWVHPISAPEFSIYDMLPEFLALLRCGNNSRVLTMLRESILDGAFASKTDSTMQVILAFVLQKQTHLLTRRMFEMLSKEFDQEPAVRHAHPVVAAVLKHLRKVPTDRMLDSTYYRIDLTVKSWAGVEFPPYYKKFRPPEKTPVHHFFYMLCFDEKHLTAALRRDIALSITLDTFCVKTDSLNLYLPAFNFSPHIQTLDQRYLEQFRDYKRLCAVPLHLMDKTVTFPRLAETIFYSSELRDAWPVNALYLTIATIQHLSWNPPEPYSEVAANPNLLHELVPRQRSNPRLSSDNAFSVVRLSDPGSFVASSIVYDLPVASTTYFVPSSKEPVPRPFPRNISSAAEVGAEMAAAAANPRKAAADKKKLGPQDDVVYMSEFLLSFEMEQMPSECSASIAELDAYFLVRDPLYLDYQNRKQEEREQKQQQGHGHSKRRKCDD